MFVVVESNILSRFKLCPNRLAVFRLGCSFKRLFYCSTTSVLHTIAVHLHGWLGRKHRTHYTRGLNATSVGLATGKSQVHGGTRPVDKVNKPVKRTWGFFVFLSHKAWSGRLENLSIHPW